MRNGKASYWISESRKLDSKQNPPDELIVNLAKTMHVHRGTFRSFVLNSWWHICGRRVDRADFMLDVLEDWSLELAGTTGLTIGSEYVNISGITSQFPRKGFLQFWLYYSTVILIHAQNKWR